MAAAASSPRPAPSAPTAAAATATWPRREGARASAEGSWRAAALSGRLRLSASGTKDSLRVAGCSNFRRVEEEKLGKLTVLDSVSSSVNLKSTAEGKADYP